jgi:8-oxo-dGTP diphosphatase
MTVSRVYLIRHAKAGDRSAWTEDDRLRPLSKAGRRQAEALVDTFRGIEVGRVASSPFVRCVQTVRPLALDRGLPVEECDELAEGADLGDALKLVSSTVDGSVFCSHGDVIPAVIDDLVAHGMRIDGEPGWKKGSTWILERSLGLFVRARYVPPLDRVAPPA